MNTSSIKSYAPKARRDFIQAVTEKAHLLGLSEEHVEPVKIKGDVAIISGRPYPKNIGPLRQQLLERINREGFEMTMRAMAYTWFNRFAAIRYMELHDYLDHGYRVLSNRSGSEIPEILEHATDVELPDLDRDEVVRLRLAGDRDNELYQLLVVAQCNALSQAMPFLFERIGGYTELLMPDNLLHSNSPVRNLVNEIPEEDWRKIEIIGWLYQFYISERKDEVIGKVVKSEDIPAATQLFTPNWIVKYMVQNSLGAQWLATYPDSPLKERMEYYIEPAEQTEEVKAQLAAITPDTLDPEALTLMDPACGSGHILVEAYELFKAIYLERGYRQRDVPQLILEKNLFGLDIDERAAQLTGFCLMMKGRADDRRFFERRVTLNVMAFVESAGFDVEGLAKGVNLGDYGLELEDLQELKRLFEHAKTFGSLIQMPEGLAENLPALRRVCEATTQDLFVSGMIERLGPLVRQGELLAGRYDAVVANPPYMGSKFFNSKINELLVSKYSTASSDIYPAFFERAIGFCGAHGRVAMITLQNWLYQLGMEILREKLIRSTSISTIIQIGFNTFPSLNSKFAIGASTVLIPRPIQRWNTRFINLNSAPRSADKESVFKNRVAAGEFFDHEQLAFGSMPGAIIAYTLNHSIRQKVIEGPCLNEITPPRRGMATGDNSTFVRLWPEVDLHKIEPVGQEKTVYKESRKKWFAYNMGGSLRKWYGNFYHVIDWERDGVRIRNLRSGSGKLRSAPRNTQHFFKQGLTWKEIGLDFCGRYFPTGVASDQTSDFLVGSQNDCYALLAFLNSSLSSHIIQGLNQSLHFNVGTLQALPIATGLRSSKFTDPVRDCVKLAKSDWDSRELSWAFERDLLVDHAPTSSSTLMDSLIVQELAENRRLSALRKLTAQIDLDLCALYGIPDNALPENTNGALGIEPLERSSRLTNMVSYAIGCMMGRYSLEAPGLIYAHSGNDGFDPYKYTTFPADEDGILPLTDTEWFADDTANRVIEFISTAWNAAHLEENLTFLADNLAPKKNESSRETLRRYLCDKFFKDHLKTYKKRPIYWLFTSGKQKAFQCLVYLHRYNESTLSRIRSSYVTPLFGHFNARLEYLQNEKEAAGTASARKKFQKEIDGLKKKLAELSAFDDELRHNADKRISLDLDDGVKVNYGKFGNLLAEKKAVTGKK